MSTQPLSSTTSLNTFNRIAFSYETAYGSNPLKQTCLQTLLSLLPPAPSAKRILDIGTGTGVPVASTLSSHGYGILGVDISPSMITHAETRIPKDLGEFVCEDFLTFLPPPGEVFSAVTIIFSLLQLTSYAEFHSLLYKFARCVSPQGGLLVIGTMPSDSYVSLKDQKEMYDATGTYVLDSGFLTPFMGGMEKTFFLSAEGLVRFIESMGVFEVVSNEIGVFQPDDERCVPEHQQYLIARRVGEGEVREPLPRP